MHSNDSNSRKCAKTTGIDTTTSKDEREHKSTATMTTRHVQESFEQEHPGGDPTTASDEVRSLVNQVVEAGAATVTVQDINFEDKFEQMIRDVNEEGIAESFLIAIYNEDSDDKDDSQQQEQEPPREREQEQQQPQHVNNNSTITSTIHQKFDLQILKELEDWIQIDPHKKDDTPGIANDEAGNGNNEDNHDNYEHKYTLDDIINF